MFHLVSMAYLQKKIKKFKNVYFLYTSFDSGNTVVHQRCYFYYLHMYSTQSIQYLQGTHYIKCATKKLDGESGINNKAESEFGTRPSNRVSFSTETERAQNQHSNTATERPLTCSATGDHINIHAYALQYKQTSKHKLNP